VDILANNQPLRKIFREAIARFEEAIARDTLMKLEEPFLLWEE
jgi:hypothetical protein